MARIQSSLFLRRALALDAIASSATGALCIIGAGFLAPILGFPADFLRTAGLILIPFVIFIAWLAMQRTPTRATVVLLIGMNLIWVADSFILLLGDWFAPTALGIAFVVAQALAVLAFAALQWMGLKRSPVHA